jgi:hypothetical protein
MRFQVVLKVGYFVTREIQKIGSFGGCNKGVSPIRFEGSTLDLNDLLEGQKVIGFYRIESTVNRIK